MKCSFARMFVPVFILTFEVSKMKTDMLDRNDLEAVRAHGLTEQEVENQLEQFRRGFPYSEIVRPAVAGDGVVCLGEDEIRRLGVRYDEAARTERIVKFVPASGAATRMFKGLYEFLATGSEDKATAKGISVLGRGITVGSGAKVAAGNIVDKNIKEGEEA